MNTKQKEIFDRITEIRDRMEDAKCELALLRQDCERLKGERDAAIQRAEKAEKETKELRSTLELLEWYGHRTHDLRQCLVCFGLERDGLHRAKCFIAQALYPDLYPIAWQSSKEKETGHA